MKALEDRLTTPIINITIYKRRAPTSVKPIMRVDGKELIGTLSKTLNQVIQKSCERGCAL
jgi:hypothetical protein